MLNTYVLWSSTHRTLPLHCISTFVYPDETNRLSICNILTFSISSISEAESNMQNCFLLEVWHIYGSAQYIMHFIQTLENMLYSNLDLLNCLFLNKHRHESQSYNRAILRLIKQCATAAYVCITVQLWYIIDSRHLILFHRRNTLSYAV